MKWFGKTREERALPAFMQDIAVKIATSLPQSWKDKLMGDAAKDMIPGGMFDSLGSTALLAMPDSMKDKIMEKAMKDKMDDMSLNPLTWFGKKREVNPFDEENAQVNH